MRSLTVIAVLFAFLILGTLGYFEYRAISGLEIPSAAANPIDHKGNEGWLIPAVIIGIIGIGVAISRQRINHKSATDRVVYDEKCVVPNEPRVQHNVRRGQLQSRQELFARSAGDFEED